MVSSRLAWGPREAKSLCIVDLALAPDVAGTAHPLHEVLRMCIDFCSQSVLQERRRLDPHPSPPESLADFRTFSEYFKSQREAAERNPWRPTVEVIPPTTLFTDAKHPGIRIHLALPSEIAVEVRNQFEQTWQELMADITQCGVEPFLNLHRKPVVMAIPAVKAEYPLNRWGPLLMGIGLICVKNPRQLIVS